MKNIMLVLIFFLISLLVISCNNKKTDISELSKLRINKILQESKNHVMLNSNIPNFSKMDSMEYKSIWNALAKKSADIEYNARGSYVHSQSCLKDPSVFPVNSVQYQSAKYDSVHYLALKDKIIYMQDSTDFDNITYLDILIHYERLARISRELKSFCND